MSVLSMNAMINYADFVKNEITFLIDNIDYNPETTIPTLAELLNEITDNDSNTYTLPTYVDKSSSTDLFNELKTISAIITTEISTFISQTSDGKRPYEFDHQDKVIQLSRLVFKGLQCLNALEAVIPENDNFDIIKTLNLKQQLLKNVNIISECMRISLDLCDRKLYDEFEELIGRVRILMYGNIDGVYCRSGASRQLYSVHSLINESFKMLAKLQVWCARLEESGTACFDMISITKASADTAKLIYG